MQTQKTKKGQPVMRNYVKYALAKLEETLEKEKHQKQQKTKWSMDILDLSYTFVKCLGSNYPYKYNKTHKGMKRVQNRQFLSQKNLAMTRLLSEIDTPE